MFLPIFRLVFIYVHAVCNSASVEYLRAQKIIWPWNGWFRMKSFVSWVPHCNVEILPRYVYIYIYKPGYIEYAETDRNKCVCMYENENKYIYIYVVGTYIHIWYTLYTLCRLYIIYDPVSRVNGPPMVSSPIRLPCTRICRSGGSGGGNRGT